MDVLSAAEMQACDRLTTERFGIPSIELMRAASAAVAAFARQEFPRARRVTVLCGRGNNGGDGMMAARLLASAGLEVTTLLLGGRDGLKGDAATAWRDLTSPAHGMIAIIETAADLEAHKAALETDLIIDAVVGTGFKPPLKGLALAALRWMEASTAPVLAVDLPSGWAADETAATVAGPVFPADAVITFTAPKPAHVFGQLTRHWGQPVVVAPIGSPDEAMVSTLNLSWAGESLALAQEPRASAANKGGFGHVLVVGGTFGTAGGKAGAPAMTALSALRAGAGLVTAAVPAPALATVSAIAPELMTWPLAATQAGSIAAENLAPEFLSVLTAGKTVLAIGPGLGQNPETVKFTTGFLSATKIPAVIDADALNILAAKPVLLTKLAKGRTLVLTPHPGEMARLAQITVAEVQADRLGVARSFAQRTGVTLVLKGARTLIAHPDGRVAVNTTGNPGMAKGGSGDLLTGLIAGLLAQYPAEVARAVAAAVYLHGLAADMTVRAGNEHTLLATDSLAQLALAFRFQTRGPNGYLWIQGLLTGLS
ncbi:MAG TPA: NAD(P)H-hydrate dehydratase [Terracidiphilus sp.]|nr:NAD(P)H-hydrate dehydratase [Terracidiphilus sp.]